MATNLTVIEVPEWVINVHNFRQDLFLKVVEPIIVFMLGPVEDGGVEQPNYHDNTNHNMYDPFQQQQQYQEFTPMTTITNNNNTTAATTSFSNRRLNFLPNYVEDVSAFRETSMSFATLTMLFTIMTCIMIVFLSCFYHNQKTSPLFISPRRHRLPRLVPPPLPVDGTFSWIKVCFYMSDEEVRMEYEFYYCYLYTKILCEILYPHLFFFIILLFF